MSWALDSLGHFACHWPGGLYLGVVKRLVYCDAFLNVIWLCFECHLLLSESFPGTSIGKESARGAGDPGSVPGSGRSPGEGNGNPFQDSCLENSMDRGARWATVHGVTRSEHIQTWAFKPQLTKEPASDCSQMEEFKAPIITPSGKTCKVREQSWEEMCRFQTRGKSSSKLKWLYFSFYAETLNLFTHVRILSCLPWFLLTEIPWKIITVLQLKSHLICGF